MPFKTEASCPSIQSSSASQAPVGCKAGSLANIKMVKEVALTAPTIDKTIEVAYKKMVEIESFMVLENDTTNSAVSPFQL